MKGIISLDIDGTITVPGQPIPNEVIDFFAELHKKGWVFVFITGRTLRWAEMVLHVIPFPYFVCVQNGAITLEMPSRNIFNKKYLSLDILPIMHEICAREPTDFVVYTGCEYDDRCYYRPNHFSEELLNYLKIRSEAYGEIWQEVDAFEGNIPDHFPSVKCFGLHRPALIVAKQIEDRIGLHVPVIRDPFNADYFVAQATHPEVNKGHAVRQLSTTLKNQGSIIAAGDDYNDLSMLQVADVRVVMETAPENIRKMAHIIAPRAESNGIIEGLKRAIDK